MVKVEFDQLKRFGQTARQLANREDVKRYVAKARENVSLTLGDPKAVGLALLALGLSGTAALFLSRTVLAAEKALSDEHKSVMQDYMSTFTSGMESVMSTITAEDTSLKDKVINVGRTAFQHAQEADGELLSVVNVLRRDKRVLRNAAITAAAGTGAAIAVFAYSKRIQELRQQPSVTPATA